jgi:hypothetical protein
MHEYGLQLILLQHDPVSLFHQYLQLDLKLQSAVLHSSTLAQITIASGSVEHSGSKDKTFLGSFSEKAIIAR